MENSVINWLYQHRDALTIIVLGGIMIFSGYVELISF